MIRPAIFPIMAICASFAFMQTKMVGAAEKNEQPGEEQTQDSESAASAKTGRKDSKSTRKPSRRTFNVQVDYEQSLQRRKAIVSAISSCLASGKLLTEPEVRESIVKKISEQMPYEPTEPLQLRTREELSAMAGKEVDAKYDVLEASFREKAEREAEKKFPLYRFKDEVTLVYQKGPRTYVVSGKLYQARDGIVQIDDTKIAFVDLPEADLAKFDVDANLRQRALYVENEMSRFERAKNEDFQKLLSAYWREMIQLNESKGYIYQPDQNRWQTVREVVETEMRKASAIQRKALARRKQEKKEKPLETETETKTTAGEEKTAASTEAADHESLAMKKKYEEIRARSQEALTKLEDVYRNGGVDIDPGYKYALWGYSVSESRAALAMEPEGKYRLVEKPGLDLYESGVEREPQDFDELPEKLELIYQNGMLDKVVAYYPDATFDLFQNLLKSLLNKYGRSEEERGAQEAGITENLLHDIFAGSIEMLPIEEGMEVPFVFSKLTLQKNSEGKDIAPYQLTWRGQTGVVSLVFYCDFKKKIATSIVLCKEHVQAAAEEPAPAQDKTEDAGGES